MRLLHAIAKASDVLPASREMLREINRIFSPPLICTAAITATPKRFALVLDASAAAVPVTLLDPGSTVYRVDGMILWVVCSDDTNGASLVGTINGVTASHALATGEGRLLKADKASATWWVFASV